MTIYSFGYEGWGPHVPRLLEVFRQVSQARGRGEPLLVDTRVRREVRAPGFTPAGIKEWATPENYRWLQGLGNVYMGGQHGPHTLERPGWRNIAILDGREIATLADLAERAERAGRDLIFFCHCPLPRHNCQADGSGCFDCHRSAIGELLAEELARRELAFSIQEWPDGRPEEVQISLPRPLVRKLLARHYRKTLPFDALESLGLLCLPWGSRVLVTEEGADSPALGFISGPARPAKSQDWLLPVLAQPLPADDLAELAALSTAFVARHGLGPLEAGTG